MRDPQPEPRRRPQSGRPSIPPGPIRVVLDEELASGGTATASVYEFNGTDWIDSTRDVTVREIIGVGSALAAATVCIAQKFGLAGWCITAAACPGE